MAQRRLEPCPPRWLNELLKKVLQWEIKLSALVPLPFGTTLYAVVKKGKLSPDFFVDSYQDGYLEERPLIAIND